MSSGNTPLRRSSRISRPPKRWEDSTVDIVDDTDSESFTEDEDDGNYSDVTSIVTSDSDEGSDCDSFLDDTGEDEDNEEDTEYEDEDELEDEEDEEGEEDESRHSEDSG